MRNILLLIFAVLTGFNSSAQRYVLSGQVTGHNNMPVPFALVYIKNTSYGSTANENGDYLFKLPPGIYDIVYRVVGCIEKIDKVTITNHDEQRNVQLDDASFQLNAGKSKADDKNDSANDIMRQVVSKRKIYLNEANSYSCVIYIKGVNKITSVPKSLADRGMAALLGLDTNGKGVSYQSESLSSYSFKHTGKIKEISIASTTVGMNPPFGYNKASDLQVNFYKNLFFIDGLSSHRFVSPAGAYAFKYYKFKLLGTISADGKKIDKIQLLSKAGKPLSFSGTIYIVEEDWRIYSVDVMLTKKFNNLNFIDTLRIKQQYIPVGRVWEPLSFQYSYSGNVNGLKFNGYYLGIINNYKIDTAFHQGYFNGEILHVDTNTNKRSSSFWADVRPMPLIPAEARNYKGKDDIVILRESKTYLDSIQHKENKFDLFSFIAEGYLATYKNQRDTLHLNPFYQTLYYNTVEGWGIYLKGTYTTTWKDNRSLSISPVLRYGFSDKLFSANLHSAYTYSPEHAGKFFLDFGSDVLDLNSLGTYPLYFNTLLTLFIGQNDVKYYRSVFGKFGNQLELTNGILWAADLSYTQRTQLYNTSFDNIFTIGNKGYTSNNPLMPKAPENDNSVLFLQNQALIFNTSLRFTFDQQYITRPAGKVYLPSLYPVITLNYRKGINAVFGSGVNYDFVSLQFSQNYIPAGLFGHSAFMVKAGGFLNRRTVYFMDYNQFFGNEAVISDPTDVGSFHFLPFYTFSTEDPFIEAHFQHNFAGSFFDNFSFLRKLKLEEIVGANYLAEKNNPNYSEFYVGIKRLIFGVDYGVSYQGNKRYLQGFRIFYGLK